MSSPLSVPQEALLVAYLDGDLCLQDAAELEQCLATEPALAAAFRSLVRAEQLLRSLTCLSARSATLSAATLLLLLLTTPSLRRPSAYRAAGEPPRCGDTPDGVAVGWMPRAGTRGREPAN